MYVIPTDDQVRERIKRIKEQAPDISDEAAEGWACLEALQVNREDAEFIWHACVGKGEEPPKVEEPPPSETTIYRRFRDAPRRNHLADLFRSK
jgi:hypothetical protein